VVPSNEPVNAAKEASIAKENSQAKWKSHQPTKESGSRDSQGEPSYMVEAKRRK
jgi:hypothetical protein